MLTQEKLNSSFLSIQVISVKLLLVQLNAVCDFVYVIYPFVKTYLPERSLNQVFCALTILCIMAFGFILFSERLGSVRTSFESQTDSRKGFVHQPCLPR